MGQAATTANTTMKYFRWPRTVIGRFVARRTIRGAAFWAIALGAIVASKAIGYASLYPTVQSRVKLATAFGSNVGLSALFGAPHQLQTVAGYVVWNTLASTMIVGSIWAFLVATKTFRGEETAGRTELLLAGQTTARRAAVNTLVGLGVSLSVLYIVTAGVFIGVGRDHSVDFGTQAALFFALTAVSGAVLFMSIGALASQLMPTRGRAAGLSAGLFGLFFLIRSAASVTSAHWLLNLSPLGWIEKLQPLYASQPLWLLPILGLTAILCVATVYLAGSRDLGASTFADRDSAKPRLALLNSPFGAAFRLNRSASISWLAGISFVAVFFGLLTKTASQAFSGPNFQHDINRIVHSSQTQAATAFLGIIFFLIMPLLMAYVASAVGRVREDEASGYLDNFLVNPVSRLRWLWERIALIVIVIVVASLCGGIGAWIGASSQQAGVAFHSILLAGLNVIAPALITLGIGVFAFGIIPRFTTIIAYSVIAWSFLLQIISSGLNLNHWILDSSVLSHVTLAPAVNPDWRSAAVLAGLGLVLSVIGGLRFNGRDLQAE